MKKYFKYIFYRIGVMHWADAILYRFSRIKNKQANLAFCSENPNTLIPPDYFLYETYRLDYGKYIEDGKLAAKEIAEWSAPYLPIAPGEILDWGCGTGRITRHLQSCFPSSIIHGCDSHAEMIAWNRQHYPDIKFSVINHSPPAIYSDAQFVLAIGFSVLTHIDAGLQKPWLAELNRILKPGGILIISTHGAAYIHQLIPSEKHILNTTGLYTRPYSTTGHRMVSTYHNAVIFRQVLEEYFTVLEHHDGNTKPAKIGGQDLWILHKT